MLNPLCWPHKLRRLRLYLPQMTHDLKRIADDLRQIRLYLLQIVLEQFQMRCNPEQIRPCLLHIVFCLPQMNPDLRQMKREERQIKHEECQLKHERPQFLPADLHLECLAARLVLHKAQMQAGLAQLLRS